MHIAVEGCSHGELDTIYTSIKQLESVHDVKVDLLLCCGDFQSVRNEQDLKCMAVPIKFMKMHDFHKYYSGEKKAPILTIFIGGNHEASNYLQELPYGGWVAPNIYYMGYAGVINVGGLRIGGVSGIYKGHDYLKGHYEKPPYSDDTIRSVYHVRNLEVFRLKQLSGHIDIFMSHDWPRGIYNYGNVDKLLSHKQFFKDEISNNTLGSRAAEEVLHKLKPDYWFSGHLHCKFAAVVNHEQNNGDKSQCTKFLALDKCLPRRQFLQILQLGNSSMPLSISHDLEWLTILRLTNDLLSIKKTMNYMPGPGSNERCNYTPTQEELQQTMSLIENDLQIAESSFAQTCLPFDNSKNLPNMRHVTMPQPMFNPQTQSLSKKLSMDDPVALLTENQNSFKCNDSSRFISPCKSPMNKSEMNITLEGSTMSINPDEVELESDVDSGDSTTGDIVLDLTCLLDDSQSDSVNTSFATTGSASPLQDLEANTSQDSSPTRSYCTEIRNKLSLSKPVLPSVPQCSASNLGEGEGECVLPIKDCFGVEDTETLSSDDRSFPVKRQSVGRNTCQEKLLLNNPLTDVPSDASVPVSGVPSGRGGTKKIKRRNAAIYASEDS